MTTDAQAVPLAERRERSLPWGILCAAVLFAGFFLCTWLVVNPRLFYFSAALDFPSFRTGPAQWQEVSAEPGGPVRYASAMLAQSCYVPWAGALVLTALAALLCGAVGALYRRSGGGGIGLLSLVPAVLLLALQCRYVFIPATTLGLSVAAIAALMYSASASRGRLLGAVLLMALTPAVYWSAGGMVLVFGATCAVVALRRRNWGHALPAVAAAALVPPAWGMAVLALSPQDAYLRLLPFHDLTDARLPYLQAVLCAYPVLFLAVAIPTGGRGEPAGGRHRWGAAAAVLVLASCAAVAWLAPDRLARAYLRVEAAGRTGDWGALLAAARMIPAEDYSFGVSFAVDRALWHEGRLLDDMFAFPQHPLGLMQAPEHAVGVLAGDPGGLVALSDVYYDLGRMNEAEHLAHEAISMGYRPWIAERLARTRLAKGQRDSARVFLNALAEDLVYGSRACHMLDALSAPEGGTMLPSHAWATPTDEVGLHTVPENLIPLVSEGQGSRMALDYLVAERLLDGDTAGVVSMLGTMREQGVTELPRYCQEAVLIQRTQSQGDIDLHGFGISPEAVARFADFLATLRRLEAEPETTARLLDQRFGDSYFHYYFGGCPAAPQEGPTP
jgi:hypothetical protein